jgi:hypothetical protein
MSVFSIVFNLSTEAQEVFNTDKEKDG